MANGGLVFGFCLDGKGGGSPSTGAVLRPGSRNWEPFGSIWTMAKRTPGSGSNSRADSTTELAGDMAKAAQAGNAARVMDKYLKLLEARHRLAAAECALVAGE